MKSSYNKLLKKLEKLLEEEYTEDSDETIYGAIYELKKRKCYVPVTPGQFFWYVCYGEDFPFEPVISKIKCVDIGWNKPHRQLYLKGDDGSETLARDFEDGVAFTWEESAQRMYRKQLRLWRSKNETNKS